MKLEELGNNILNESEFQLDEKGFADYKAARAAADVEKELQALGQKFRLGIDDVRAVYDPVSKTGKNYKQLEAGLTNAMKADIKAGFKSGTSGALGPNTEKLVRQLTLRRVLDEKTVLSKVEIERIHNEVRNNVTTKLRALEGKSAVPGGTTPGGTTPPTPGPTTTTTGMGTRIKTRLKAFKDSIVKNKKTSAVIGALAVLGGAGLLAYYGLDKAGSSPEDVETVKKLEEALSKYPECVLRLKDRLTLNVNESTGEVTLIMTNTGNAEYDGVGGVVLYPDGRIVTVDGAKKGKYTCKSLQQLQEKLNLSSIVDQIINEQAEGNQISADQMDQIVRQVIDYLDFPVSQGDLAKTAETLKGLYGKTVDGQPAGKYFLDLYQRSGLGGGDIRKSLKYVYTSDPKSVRLKDMIGQIVSKLETDSSSSATTPGGNSNLDDVLDVVWDGGEQPVSPTPQPSRKYKPCTGTYTYGCMGDAIAQVQKCLGIDPDGKFGPVTLRTLKAKANMESFTDADIQKICASASSNQTQPAQQTQPAREPGMAPMATKGANLAGTQAPTELAGQPQMAYSRYKLNFSKDPKNANRLRYKGQDIDMNDLKLIDQYLKEKYGLTRVKQKPKDYGYKYVWAKV